MIIVTEKVLDSYTPASIKMHNIGPIYYMLLKSSGGSLKKIKYKEMKKFLFHLSIPFMICVQYKTLTSYINFK